MINISNLQKDVESQLLDPVELLHSDFGAELIPLFCLYTFIQIPCFPRYSFIVFEASEGVYFCKYHWGAETAEGQNAITANGPPKYLKCTGIVRDNIDGWLHFLENLDLSVKPSKSHCGIDGERHGLKTYFMRHNFEESWVNSGPKERSDLVNWHSEVVNYLNSLIK